MAAIGASWKDIWDTSIWVTPSIWSDEIAEQPEHVGVELTSAPTSELTFQLTSDLTG